MWAQVDQILRQATTQIADHIANFLPGLLVSLTLIFAAFVVALLARMLLVRALRGLDFDRRAEQSGTGGARGMAGVDKSLTDGRARRLLDDSDTRPAGQPDRTERHHPVAARVVGLRVRPASAGRAHDPHRRRGGGEVSRAVGAHRRRQHADPVRPAAEPRRSSGWCCSSRWRWPSIISASAERYCCWPSRSCSAASSSRPRWPSDSARETSSAGRSSGNSVNLNKATTKWIMSSLIWNDPLSSPVC